MTKKKPKILYVDDEPVNLSNFQLLLKRDYEVLTAVSPEEGLELFQQEGGIEVVITDQKMPHMSGAEFLAEIIKINPDPIRIMLSAFYTDHENVLAAINVGKIFQFIRKPMDINEIKLVLRQSVDKFRLLQENIRLQKELETEKEQLEGKVKARTTDLFTAYQKLAQAVSLKDEFLANMSHELRTPLTSILGMTETLADGIFGSLTEKQLQFINTINDSGTHLLELINDILDVAKIEAGKLELLTGRVSVESLCQSSVRLVRQAAREKGIEVSVRTDHAVANLSADMLRLKQILVNLLSNAIKFSKPYSEIVLEVVSDSEQGITRFMVRDQGIGIPPQEIERLFEPFEQLDASFSREHGGTGLGLSLVRSLTEMHGGSVSVESEPGKGSCFTVMLPSKITGEGEEEEGNEPDMTSHAEQKEGHILFAEDNNAILNTVVPYLEACGYAVATAHNGVEAVEHFFSKRPDIILMDIQMPVMDGLAAIVKIRDIETQEGTISNMNCPRKAVPIIALTALALKGDREKCLDAGANGYMTKPVKLQELATEINRRIGALGKNDKLS